ncbi:hypothetical protein LAZ67_19000186, partial [Cordylochernes scorpioides]
METKTDLILAYNGSKWFRKYFGITEGRPAMSWLEGFKKTTRVRVGVPQLKTIPLPTQVHAASSAAKVGLVRPAPLGEAALSPTLHAAALGGEPHQQVVLGHGGRQVQGQWGLRRDAPWAGTAARAAAAGRGRLPDCQLQGLFGRAGWGQGHGRVWGAWGGGGGEQVGLRRRQASQWTVSPTLESWHGATHCGLLWLDHMWGHILGLHGLHVDVHQGPDRGVVVVQEVGRHYGHAVGILEALQVALGPGGKVLGAAGLSSEEMHNGIHQVGHRVPHWHCPAPQIAAMAATEDMLDTEAVHRIRNFFMIGKMKTMHGHRTLHDVVKLCSQVLWAGKKQEAHA